MSLAHCTRMGKADSDRGRSENVCKAVYKTGITDPLPPPSNPHLFPFLLFSFGFYTHICLSVARTEMKVDNEGEQHYM